MKNRIIAAVLTPLFCIACSQATAKGSHVSIKLSFDSDPKCMVDGKKPAGDAVKSSKSYDDSTISWSTRCEVTFPKDASHCVLTGQGISNPDAVSQWSVTAMNGKVVASMTSEADINPDFGKLEAHYFCH